MGKNGSRVAHEVCVFGGGQNGIWDRNEYGACLHNYTMDADLRVYCICGPPLTGLGGGRCAGFRKVWRERSVGSGAVGTGEGK